MIKIQFWIKIQQKLATIFLLRTKNLLIINKRSADLFATKSFSLRSIHIKETLSCKLEIGNFESIFLLEKDMNL